jgi:hypothetical protein
MKTHICAVLLIIGLSVVSCSSSPDSPDAVNLGAAGSFVILAKSGVENVPTSDITGDIGLSPAAATYLKGFSQTMDSTVLFSESAQVEGRLYASDYAAPTPANLTAAVSAMEAAYTDAAGRSNPTYTEYGAGDLSGKTLAPGLYKWGTGVLITSDVTLDGSSSDVWIFQIASGLTIASGTRVVLAGGAQARNVYWQSAGAVSINTTAHLEGIVLSLKEITLATGATVKGRLHSQTEVTLDGNVVTTP